MSDKEELVIDKDTTPGHIEQRIGVGEEEELRSSNRREDYLKRFTRVLTGEGVDLRLHPSKADTKLNENPPSIRIPSRPDGFPQPLTEFPTTEYDMLVQETVSLHEAGHVLYTDWGAFKERIEDEVDKSHRPIYKDVWNIFEDGAIEEQLRAEFKCSEELLIFNSNFIEKNQFGTRVSPDELYYTFHNAVTAALVDLSIINSGTLDKILDEDNEEHVIADEEDKELFEDFLPTIRDAVTSYISEPNAEARDDILWDFWQEYKDKLEEAEVGGLQSAQNEEESEVFSGKGQDALDGYDLRDMDEANMEAKYDATGLPSKEELEERLEELAEEEEEEEEEEAETGGDSGGVGEEGEDDAKGSGSIGGDKERAKELEEEMKEKYEEEVSREAREQSGDMMDDALEYLDIFSEGATDANLQEVAVASETEDWDLERWREVQRRSNIIEGTLRRRLRRESRSKKKRWRRRGKLDIRAMTRAARGSTRVFERSEEDDQKEYSCMVVVDRSGSMGGRKMTMAENGATAFLKALNNLGIDTTMLDLHKNTPRIAIPYGGDIEEHRGRVLTNDSGGGTPLSDVIHLARERIEREAEKFPFMIVITDGKPANDNAYKEALDAVNFPVIGVNINLSKSNITDADEYFHRQVEVRDETDLYTKLEQLAEEVLF